MPVQALLVMLIGLLFIYLGYLIFKGKMPNLLDYFLKQGVAAYNDKLSLKFFGPIIMIIGIIVLILPFLLGIENMNL